MLSLPIYNSQYRYLIHGFREYLQTLGYAMPTVESWPVHVREFLHYLESRNLYHVQDLQPQHLKDFIRHIKRRPAGKGGKQQSKGAALSSSSIDKIINAVNMFSRYLNSTGRCGFGNITDRAGDDDSETPYCTVEEVKRLYAATFHTHQQNSIAIGQRDRAIIAIFYGCGLRRSEGLQLDTADIDLQKNLLFVRNGKGNKQRYVPIAAKHAQDLRDYIEQSREWFLHTQSNRSKRKPPVMKPEADTLALLLAQSGARLGGAGLEQRLKQLSARAEIGRVIAPHELRHSIATHLLQQGMDIEEIAKMLGHASLVSTQIYTHIVENIKTQETRQEE